MSAKMKEESENSLIKAPVVEEWIVASSMTIQSEFGFSQIQCDFYHTGKVVITDYTPSIKDLHCPDIRCLKRWVEVYGWKELEPTEAVIDTFFDFWKNQWETYVIDSSVLDKRYGDRSDMYFGEDEDLDLDLDDI